jgi:hypothetical protein
MMMSNSYRRSYHAQPVGLPDYASAKVTFNDYGSETGGPVNAVTGLAVPVQQQYPCPEGVKCPNQSLVHYPRSFLKILLLPNTLKKNIKKKDVAMPHYYTFSAKNNKKIIFG